MAAVKYFADLPTGTLEFTNVDHRKDGAYGYDHGTKTWVKTSRRVFMKNNPSRHECDSRCINAKGRTMNCECSCGGKNHGKGY